MAKDYQVTYKTRLRTRLKFFLHDAVLFTALTASALIYLQVQVNGLHSLLTRVDNGDVPAQAADCCRDELTAYLSEQEARALQRGGRSR